MQITALSFIKTIHTIQILIETKDTYPFYQTIIIKKRIKFKALGKLDNDNVNDNAVICILRLKNYYYLLEVIQ